MTTWDGFSYKHQTTILSNGHEITEMPKKTPSTLSRDRTLYGRMYDFDRGKVESILGKRKAEQSPSPVTKRSASLLTRSPATDDESDHSPIPPVLDDSDSDADEHASTGGGEQVQLDGEDLQSFSESALGALRKKIRAVILFNNDTEVDQPSTRNKQTDPWRLSFGFHDKPTEDEFLIMPTNLPGYDLQEKEWVDLPVSTLTSVRWNKQPFEDLVLDPETKPLVQAMVTVRASSIKTRRQRGPRVDYDVIAGKGNGLIMLFHGSPGTGKTLTAESVAEIAEMPLFPITCGDIGTEPDKVETYLQLAFELGQRWNCVLLLDEADVFLEERTLTDLQRNSLVSVFLRMLEYYEGILILTSNRVGAFDEAFRSRIHIAIHYEDLKPRSRKKIWSNFLSRLEGTEEGENIAEIEERLDELANHKLNGREIRNALSTARQLAHHKGENMGWEHLELAIKTANKFGKYLTDVHGHSANSWAKEKRERL
ncbi:hypothetical protein E8E13_000147 [Curvularia kusanoi]|uniref:AAA+ ATPase domain-containing protein n=1 Tax=Curvularia kusanoi TaxID=90978 RepID=A0A9P4T7Z5_CURKU|nr:hypothetical protein E8E13_000147 [Curvularia kusanoi]